MRPGSAETAPDASSLLRRAALGPGLSRVRAAARLDLWTVGTLLIAAIVFVPIAAVVWMALFPTENIWPHLIDTVLPGYVQATILLMLGVGIGTFVIGTGTAWLVTMTRFPGRKVFEWALLAPLAVPAYVIAYVYTDFLEYAGPVQGALRALFGWETSRDYWFPEIRSLGGAISMLTLVLYPYVYLLARSAFLEQSVAVLEVSRTLGCTPWGAFRRVALPLARPSIVVGLALVMMETINDYGTVDYFAVRTLSAGIFNVWLLMGNRGGGAQVALVLLAFVLALLLLERFGRRRKGYHNTGAKHAPIVPLTLSPLRQGLAFLACALPVTLGFLLPGGRLAMFAAGRFGESWDAGFLGYAANSLLLSGGAALAAMALGLFMAYAVRLGRGGVLRAAVRFASLGYAVPGAVLAIGVLVPFGAFDNWLDALARAELGFSTGLLLSGSVAGLMFAYVVRFLALSYGTVEAGLGRVKPTLDMAARTLGQGPAGVLWRVHAPIIRGSLLTAALLVFVDCMKELPATLLLRPFNFDTLATYVYQYAGDERLEESALAALSIVVVGLLPVILLSKSISRGRQGAG